MLQLPSVVASRPSLHRVARALRRPGRVLGGASVIALMAAGCGSSTAPKAKIAFAPSTVTLTAVAGGTASGSVAVRNSGGGSLTGLSAAVGAYSTGASGWLTATLATANAPTAINLVADATSLTAGSYQAVVNVSATDASPPTATLTVTLTVTH